MCKDIIYNTVVSFIIDNFDADDAMFHYEDIVEQIMGELIERGHLCQ